MRQIEAHEGIAGLHHGEEYGHIGLCSRMGLHVGILGAVEFAHTLDGQTLHLVHHLATAVITRCGISLGVLVGEHRSHCCHNLVADEVLRRDKLYAAHLTGTLLGYQVENLSILFHLRVLWL